MPRDTAIMKFSIPSSLLDALRGEALRANLSLGSYVITILNARKIAAEPKPPRETAAEKKARVAAVSKAHFMDRSAKLLSEGVSPDAIMLQYPSPEWSARERAEMAAWLIEVIESVG